VCARAQVAHRSQTSAVRRSSIALVRRGTDKGTAVGVAAGASRDCTAASNTPAATQEKPEHAWIIKLEFD